MMEADPLEELEAILACLDAADPFEVDGGNLPHLFADCDFNLDDARDVLAGAPEFYEDETDGSGEWLMVGPVPGEPVPLVVVLTRGSTFSQLRPITVFRAGRDLADRYRHDTGW